MTLEMKSSRSAPATIRAVRVLRRLRFPVLALCAAALLPLAASAQACTSVAGNLVQNCGFETSAPAWTSSVAIGGFFGPDGVRVHTGGGAWAFADLDGLGVFHTEAYNRANNIGYLSQTIATTPGQRYTLSFWLYNAEGNNPAPYSGGFLWNEFKASWGGTTVFDLVDDNPFAGGFSPPYPYVQYTVAGLLATSNATSLSLGGYQNISAYVLDDIAVSEEAPITTTPEPSTWMLVASGLAGTGLLARRRRQR